MSQVIQKKSLAEAVAEKIQEQVKDGKYAINEKLPTEPDLMKSFGVGRSTIREAIKTLIKSGLLRVQQGAGTFVEKRQAGEPFDNHLGKADYTHLTEVRELLERKIAEKACLNRTKEDLVAIGKFLKQRKAAAVAGNTAACIEADINFHVAIAAACGNPILLEIYSATSTHLYNRFKNTFSNTDNFIVTQNLHEALYNHIKKSDPQKALEAVEQIVGHV